MSQPFSNFRGKEIYIDAMIFHAILRASDVRAKAILTQVEQGTVEAYASVLTMNELAHHLLISMIRDKYGDVSTTELQRQRVFWVVEFYPQIEAQLQELQFMPNLLVIGLEQSIISKMHQNSINYRLLPRNALHLAAMQTVGCQAILSHDSNFDGIPYIERYTVG